MASVQVARPVAFSVWLLGCIQFVGRKLPSLSVALFLIFTWMVGYAFDLKQIVFFLLLCTLRICKNQTSFLTHIDNNSLSEDILFFFITVGEGDVSMDINTPGRCHLRRPGSIRRLLLVLSC